MLVARREPPFHADPHNPGPVDPGVYAAAKASKLTRFVTAIQLVGSLLAVPIGIASAYSFYRANFSPDTTCQNLRSGIIAMLDKSVDAATRRILVRRDVEAFEKTCGTVDPDATAAFKTLLEVKGGGSCQGPNRRRDHANGSEGAARRDVGQRAGSQGRDTSATGGKTTGGKSSPLLNPNPFVAILRCRMRSGSTPSVRRS